MRKEKEELLGEIRRCSAVFSPESKTKNFPALGDCVGSPTKVCPRKHANLIGRLLHWDATAIDKQLRFHKPTWFSGKGPPGSCVIPFTSLSMHVPYGCFLHPVAILHSISDPVARGSNTSLRRCSRGRRPVSARALTTGLLQLW